ncbi:hypothetical protein BKA62DRAFT_91640 [Auriculariales sp. MPI-PUGE-AT-0066]|nr:hypothetical protein BKA62DRAFT_91640 [Auriculariales sp. MPI-PUGE-AT-0066]
MMRTLLARSSSPMPAPVDLVIPLIVVTGPDNESITRSFFQHRLPPATENGLLQVPRRVSARSQQQQQQQQQQQRPRQAFIRPPPLIRFDQPLQPRQNHPRPQPIPLPEPVPVSIEQLKIEAPASTPAKEAMVEPPRQQPLRNVLDTLKGLERYCENLVVNVRARPQSVIAAPKPVAGGNFKKAHRRVHSVEMSWNRAPPAGGRPGIANQLAQRRKRSISSADEIFIGAPKAAFARSERCQPHARRVVPRGNGAVYALPSLIEDLPVTTTGTATTGRMARAQSVDTALSQLLRVPQPTLLNTRSGRADISSLLGARVAAAAHDGSALLSEGLLPEGFSLGVVAAANYYTTLSKNAATLRKKVFQPLRRYMTV